MISQISIKNYKSIKELELELGRITVLIGENGCGKSNILEAIALCSAAAADKLDHEFLSSRGIRVPDDARFMRSAFEVQDLTENIRISVSGDQKLNETDGTNEKREFECFLQNKNNTPYSIWEDVVPNKIDLVDTNWSSLNKKIEELNEKFNVLGANFGALNLGQDFFELNRETLRAISILLRERVSPQNLQSFLIFSPENSALRTFETEAQIQPLGIKGEGLFKLLTVLSSEENKDSLEKIKNELMLLDWFDDFSIGIGVSTGERNINIKDRYLDESLSYFTQKSANEGFLFLLFYFTLFISRETPSFFAIDNIDASLNPKLCSRLLKELASLAKKHDKQAIVTTHNPAILDGLNLNDDDQRLFVVSRNKMGHTKVKRIFKPDVAEGQTPIPLSEAFLRGYLGGLPRNF